MAVRVSGKPVAASRKQMAARIDPKVRTWFHPVQIGANANVIARNAERNTVRLICCMESMPPAGAARMMPDITKSEKA